MARLSTHVLDVARGRPAENVSIDLHRIDNHNRQHLQALTTNADGRIDAPLTIEPGIYELTFQAAAYLRAAGFALTDPPFLDQIVIRFGVSDPGGRYHVPLLLSPYGYSTYRGS